MIKQDITSFLIQEKDILDGHLIGDASVFTTGTDCKRNAVMVHTSKYREYLEWIVANTQTFSTCNINENDVLDERTGKYYHRCTIKTYSHPLLTERRCQWYPEGKKIVPENIELTPAMTLRWFMDDGSWHRQGLYLCTNAYSLESNEILAVKLAKVIDGVVKIHKHSKDSYRLFIPKGRAIASVASLGSNRLKFLDYVGECPVSCFKHKWGE